MNRLIAVNHGAAATTIVALKGKSKAGQAIMYWLVASQGLHQAWRTLAPSITPRIPQTRLNAASAPADNE